MMRIASRFLRTLTWFLGLALLELCVCGLANAQGAARPTPGAAASGYIRAASAAVFVRVRNGPEVRAKVGDVFGPGTRIRTGGPGNVSLLFADGQMVTLSKDAILLVVEFRFDPANHNSDRATLELVTGSMSYVSGAIHTENPAGQSISAGGAVISIVNKDVVAFVVEVDSRSRVFISAAVTIGEIAVQSRTGTISRIAANQFVRVQPGAVPGLPLPLSAAPALYQAEIAASRASVTGSPTPIDIRSASVQAALAVAQTANSGANQDASAAGVTGTLNLVSGPVFLRKGSGAIVPAKIGDEFGPGMLVSTGTGARVGLLFAQGEYAVLDANSSLRISSSGSGTANTGGTLAPVSLLGGTMSYVSWTDFSGQSSRINLAVGNGLVSSNGQGVVAFVAAIDPNAPGSGSIAVTAGQISFLTEGRSLISLAANQFTSWQPGIAQLVIRPLNQASAQLQQAFTETLQSAPGDAEVTAALAALAPTAAGPTQAQSQTQPQIQTQTQTQSTPQEAIAPVTQTQQAQAEPVAVTSVIVPAVSAGGGRGCVGSPC